MMSFRKVSRIIILFIIPAVLLLFFNASDNKHKHLLANGQIIEHAHPFKSDNSSTPFQNHKHTPFDLVFLSFLSNSIGLIPILLVFSALFFQLNNEKIIFYAKRFVQKHYIEKYIGRAPPLSYLTK